MVNKWAQGVVNTNLIMNQVTNYLVTRQLAKRMINIKLKLRKNLRDLKKITSTGKHTVEIYWIKKNIQYIVSKYISHSFDSL
jgi:hypothetical protein